MRNHMSVFIASSPTHSSVRISHPQQKYICLHLTSRTEIFTIYAYHNYNKLSINYALKTVLPMNNPNYYNQFVFISILQSLSVISSHKVMVLQPHQGNSTALRSCCLIYFCCIYMNYLLLSYCLPELTDFLPLLFL